MPRLRRSDPHRPGYTRRRAGRGWTYLDTDGQRIADPATVGRIRALVIPPAWREVWICPYPNGHIQAVGTDAAGRRQYRYHDVWREHRDRRKHLRVLQVGERLPAMRRRWARDLRRDGLDRQRVLAAAARLLDLGLFRVGGEEYAEEHRHVRAGHPAAGARDGPAGPARLRLPGQGRPAPAGGRRASGGWPRW